MGANKVALASNGVSLEKDQTNTETHSTKLDTDKLMHYNNGTFTYKTNLKTICAEKMRLFWTVMFLN